MWVVGCGPDDVLAFEGDRIAFAPLLQPPTNCVGNGYNGGRKRNSLFGCSDAFAYPCEYFSATSMIAAMQAKVAESVNPRRNYV